VTSSRGQALVELALCLPVVVALGLGSAAVVQAVDASTGLQAAAQAAAGAAARAPDPGSAEIVARDRFAAVIASYPVRGAAVVLWLGDFNRGSTLTAAATGFVDLGWDTLGFLPAQLPVRAQVSVSIEPWRSRS
jgi:Flp pilus assembly protein TadG